MEYNRQITSFLNRNSFLTVQNDGSQGRIVLILHLVVIGILNANSGLYLLMRIENQKNIILDIQLEKCFMKKSKRRKIKAFVTFILLRASQHRLNVHIKLSYQ